MISIEAVVKVVVQLISVGFIFGLLYWLLGVCDPREPFKKAGTVLLAVLSVLCIIGILLSFMSGKPLFVP